MKLSDQNFIRHDNGDGIPPTYIAFVDFLNLNHNYLCLHLPNDPALVWFARDDGKHEFHPLLFGVNTAPNTLIIPVLMPEYSNLPVWKMRLPLTGALVSSFKTCYVRFEMVKTNRGPRAQLFLVNKTTHKKRQITQL